MDLSQSIIVSLTVISIGVALISYLHQRNEDKPIFEHFFYPHRDNSIRVEIKIKNKSKEKFTIISITATSSYKKLFIANQVVIERNGNKLYVPSHEDFHKNPYLYVPPENETSFEFFVLSGESLLNKTIRIKFQTESSFLTMIPKYKIIREKYIV